MPARSVAPLLFLLALCGPLFAAAPDAVVQSLEARGAKIKTDKSGRVTGVNLAEADVGLDQLQLLSAFSELNRLTLWGASITDAALPLLAKNPKLKTLVLENTEITGEGIHELTKLPNL